MVNSGGSKPLISGSRLCDVQPQLLAKTGGNFRRADGDVVHFVAIGRLGVQFDPRIV